MKRPVLPVLTVVMALGALMATTGMTLASAHKESEALDAKFSELLAGARLEGKFNVVGPNGMTEAQTEMYMVSELTRGEGDTWIFNYSMSSNQNQKMIPIPVEVLWAGETPVLTMTNQEIEGLEGKFTARVLIFGDRYAGTWQHGAFGGHMWGLVKKDPEE